MRLYLVTRADLRPGQQAVQAAHALAEFGLKHPEAFKAWGNQTLVMLAVPDEGTLLGLATVTARGADPHVVNREPDLGDAATSLAVMPQTGSWVQRELRGLPLALR